MKIASSLLISLLLVTACGRANDDDNFQVSQSKKKGGATWGFMLTKNGQKHFKGGYKTYLSCALSIEQLLTAHCGVPGLDLIANCSVTGCYQPK